MNGMPIQVKCKSCGAIHNLGTDCPKCETTLEIDWSSLTAGPLQQRAATKDKDPDKYCTKCGTAKKWVCITARKGLEWVCPKC